MKHPIMNSRTMAIIFLVVILIIMPYYQGIKECVENPNYETDIVDKYRYSELLNEYIILLKETGNALSSNDGYANNFKSLFELNITTR
jgi:hypothetical protein